MAIVYSQNWASGNSVFTSMDVYDRDTNGPDALYPEIENAEAVTVVGGKLDWSGTYSDYQGAGIRLQGFPTFAAGLGATGFVSCRYRPNTTSLGGGPYHPMLAVRGNSGFSPNIEIYYDGSGSPFLDIYAYDWGFGGDWNATPAWTPVADTDYVLKTCWQCQSAEGVADGFVRVYIDDVLLASVENFAFFVDGDAVYRVDFGYFGLFGALDQIVFNDVGCGSVDLSTVPGNGSTPCCGSEVKPASGGGVGATMPDNPYRPLQPWASVCAGGGTVPAAADIEDSESWA